MSTTSREDWEQLRTDPDPESDLGYQSHDWEVLSVDAEDGARQLFLPADEDQLRDDAFIVAGEMAVCDVQDCR